MTVAASKQPFVIRFTPTTAVMCYVTGMRNALHKSTARQNTLYSAFVFVAAQPELLIFSRWTFPPPLMKSEPCSVLGLQL